MNRLSILCITAGEPHARMFIRQHRHLATLLNVPYLLACDLEGIAGGAPPDPAVQWLADLVVASDGYLESVYDDALKNLDVGDPDDYILRLDDDETVSPTMEDWLGAGMYTSAPHWKFARRHLWGNAHTYITTPPLYPDHQTRLSQVQFAGGRGVIHAGSPFGGGVEVASSDLDNPAVSLLPVYIAHHKFLVKDRAQREAVAARYDAIHPGAGTSPGMIAFNLPETLPSLTLEQL